MATNKCKDGDNACTMQLQQTIIAIYEKLPGVLFHQLAGIRHVELDMEGESIRRAHCLQIKEIDHSDTIMALTRYYDLPAVKVQLTDLT